MVIKNLPRGGLPITFGWFVVVLAGLFVPLMDNDSAHHANIALRMYLTGDYVRLIDYNGPYLDKPHLHFWLSALSYHVFGVTGFAYKFPTLVFCLIAVWAVYRAASMLINEEAGRLAAIIFSSSTSFMMGMNDVRMDGILTSAVAISIWQIAGFIKFQSTRYMLGAALGFAVGFCTKGHIGVFIPGLFLLCYCLVNKSWSVLLDKKVVLGIVAFVIFITPVVYCYYLQYNLHPEVVVRGQDNINGVRFILLDQTLGRYGGEMGSDAKGDRFFFLHTFLWVFAPWSVLGIFSLLRRGGIRTSGGVTVAILLLLLIFGVLVGFSSFKLPHYLNVVLPVSAIWVAEVLVVGWGWMRKLAMGLEWLLWIVLGVFAQLLLIWWFPNQPIFFWIGFVFFLVILFYNLRVVKRDSASGMVIRITSTMLVLFWMLNTGFYRSLLGYQGGNILANSRTVRALNDPVYSLEGCYSSSFYFYTKTLRQEINMSAVKSGKYYLLLDEKQLPDLSKTGVKWKKIEDALDYEITRLSGSFLNRSTRGDVCTRLVLIESAGK